MVYSKKGIFFFKHKYTFDFLTTTKKLACKLVRTLINLNVKLGKGEDNNPINKESYQQLVGKLIYLNHTKPDITFAVRVLSRHA